MEILTRSVEGLKRLWASLTPAQRAVLVSAVAAALLLLAYTSSAAVSGSWERVAGAEVDDAARAQILERLKASRQRHEVRGKEIFVPTQDADRVVLELAGENVISDRAIFKFLENSDIFADRSLTEKRYQIALQRKLEYMIRKINAIRNASVQITPPTTSQGFAFAGAKAGASVSVELQPGRALTPANIRAIAGLVAHAVPGLDRDRVLITDNAGNPFSVPKEEAGGGLAMSELRALEERLERDIKDKITDLLPSARVSVRALLKTTSEERRETKIDPRGTVLEEKERRAYGPAEGQGGGLKGAQELAPGTPVRPSSVREQELETKYKVGETHRVLQDPRGAIERITVGVLLPVPVDAKGQPIGSRPNQEQVESLVMKAAGLKDRADVSVVLVETRAPEPIPDAAPLESVGEWFAAHWGKLAAALAAAGILIGLAVLLRAGLTRVEVEEIAARPVPPPPPVPAEEAGGERLREAVREIVRQDPAEAAASLRTWVR